MNKYVFLKFQNSYCIDEKAKNMSNMSNLLLTMVPTTKNIFENAYPYTPEFMYASDLFYTYVVPPICIFGIATNTLNIVVFSHKELTEDTYKYLKLNAYSNLVYLLICCFVFTKRCGQLCELDDLFLTQLYYWIFYSYVKGTHFVWVSLGFGFGIGSWLWSQNLRPKTVWVLKRIRIRSVPSMIRFCRKPKY